MLVAVLAMGAERVASETSPQPWLNKGSSAEVRSQQLLTAMTKAQKFQQLVGAAGQVPELPQCFGARHVP